MVLPIHISQSKNWFPQHAVMLLQLAGQENWTWHCDCIWNYAFHGMLSMLLPVSNMLNWSRQEVVQNNDFEINYARIVTMFLVQHLGNISSGDIILKNLMTLWYHWCVSKAGSITQACRTADEQLSFHCPQQHCAGFITPSFPWAFTDPTL